MAKKSAVQAIVEGKCPRCREGAIFERPNFRYKGFARMHAVCKVCGLRFDPEPGFYYGAMYVSYGFSVALTLVMGFTIYFVFSNPPTWVYTTAIIIAVLLLFPGMFRYSRILYLHTFGGIKYDPSLGSSKSAGASG